MKNFVSSGKNLTIPAPAGGVKSGVPFQSGSFVLVPVTDAIEGQNVACNLTGVYTLPCDSTCNFAFSGTVNWNPSSGKASKEVADGTIFQLGRAIAASGSSTFVQVRIEQLPAAAIAAPSGGS